ncbi:MAG TPA: 50S ribosomal protein L4 [Acidimicrobiales bacterium]|jgi:large subunit ribosomal protein L4|nr:50S ribosomal protein L4 [Acidimicrobiales bacterium]
MPTVQVRSATGSVVGTIRLDDAIFGVKPNVAVMHQVVTAQLAAARQGTQSTKTRAEVRGGGRKPWRQKGSGRARQGSTRAPHWRGGGVALGPKPRSYRQRTPKKMVQLALHSALSDRAASGRVAVVDRWAFDAPKTKDALDALRALELVGQGKVLVVLDREAEAAAKSFRNLPDVELLLDSELNAYDVLCSDWVVFTRSTLPGVTTDDASGGPAGPAGDTAPTAGERDWDAPVASEERP